MTHHKVELGGPFIRGHLVPSFVGISPTDWLILETVVSFDYSRAKGVDQRKGYSFPSNSTLSVETALSEATIKRSLRNLEEEVYLIRTRLRLGRARRDHRTVFINYARLERGHQLVLDLRARRNAAQVWELEHACRTGFLQDDMRFLKRLIAEGSVSVDDLRAKAESFACTNLGRIAGELAAAIDGSNMSLSGGVVDDTETHSWSKDSPDETSNEEDEVRERNRSALRKRSDLPSESSIHPLRHPSSNQSTDPLWNPIAGAIRRKLTRFGLEDDELEKAMNISLHCCLHAGIVDPDYAAEMAWSVANAVEDWESDFALDDFAHSMVHRTECYG